MVCKHPTIEECCGVVVVMMKWIRWKQKPLQVFRRLTKEYLPVDSVLPEWFGSQDENDQRYAIRCFTDGWRKWKNCSFGHRCRREVQLSSDQYWQTDTEEAFGALPSLLFDTKKASFAQAHQKVCHARDMQCSAANLRYSHARLGCPQLKAVLTADLDSDSQLYFRHIFIIVLCHFRHVCNMFLFIFCSLDVFCVCLFVTGCYLSPPGLKS